MVIFLSSTFCRLLSSTEVLCKNTPSGPILFFPDRLVISGLHTVQGGIFPVSAHQLQMASLLHQMPAAKKQYLIRILNG